MEIKINFETDKKYTVHVDNLKRENCGLNADFCCMAFLIKGEAWSNGSVYLLEDEHTTKGFLLIAFNEDPEGEHKELAYFSEPTKQWGDAIK